MLLDGKLDDPIDEGASDAPSKTWAVATGICLLPIYLVFALLGESGRGTAAACFVGAIIVAIKLHWALRSSTRFWIIISGVILLHVPLIFLVPWPNKNYTLPIVLPIGILDYMIIALSLKAVQRD